MARRKTERLLNLTIALLTSGRFVTKQQIRQVVEGYDQTNDAAFERQFERDKDELRALGIPITTGSNDVLFDDDLGYRIARTDFELPEISFNAEELTALGVAATMWQQNLLSEVTSSAIHKLRAGGVELDAERLGALVPHLCAKEDAFEPLWEAVSGRQLVNFSYRGAQRRVQPWRLLSRRGAWYLIGQDLDRNEPRVFKLARFDDIPITVGDQDAFRPPSDEDVRRQIAKISPAAPDKVARVAITDNGAPELRRRGHRTDSQSNLPAGYQLYEVPYASAADLVSEVCAAGRDALLVEPVELGDMVISRLSAIAVEGR